jgi:M6 family metalloprotease-like protein
MKAKLKLSFWRVFAIAMSLLVSPLFADDLGNPCAIPSSGTGGSCEPPSYSPVGNPQPTTGTVRALFIFVKFPDDTFENNCTGEWNHITYNTTRPPWTNQIVDSSIMQNQTSGSLSDYFDAVSYGQFQMIGDIYPQNNLVYVPPFPESYYVRNCSYAKGDTLRRGIGYLNSEILKDLNSVIDYSLYDTNPADGILDMVFIMYRKYDISTAGNCEGSYTGIAKLDPCDDGFFPITLDGIQIRSGLFGSGATLRHALQLNDTRNLVAHEYGHFWFGYTHFGDVLGEFGYSNGKPAGRGAFDKVKLGWVTPTTITVNTPGLTIDDLATHNNAVYRVLIPGYTNRYFLLENRQRTNLYEQQYTGGCGNLAGLPATGLLITEIGPGSSYPISSIQDYPIDIREADNSWSFPGDAGDTYKPGNKIQFTPWTKPNSDYGSTNTGRAVTNIQQSGNQISADIVLNFSSGTLTENSWWEVSESITGNVTLISGKTLTVTPNTTVTFSSGATLTVNGSLVANSTSSSQRITFTRQGTSSTWNGSKSTPAAVATLAPCAAAT